MLERECRQDAAADLEVALGKRERSPQADASRSRSRQGAGTRQPERPRLRHSEQRRVDWERATASSGSRWTRSMAVAPPLMLVWEGAGPADSSSRPCRMLNGEYLWQRSRFSDGQPMRRLLLAEETWLVVTSRTGRGRRYRRMEERQPPGNVPPNRTQAPGLSAGSRLAALTGSLPSQSDARGARSRG
jgi:hypothetical protein